MTTARIPAPAPALADDVAEDPDGRQIDVETGEILSEHDGATVRPFIAFLQEYQHGELHDELSTALNAVVTAVQGVGKKAVLTLQVEVKLAGKRRNQVFVGAKVTTKLPEPDREEAIFFVDHDGNLTRQDPEQLELPNLRQVPARGNRTTKEIAR